MSTTENETERHDIKGDADAAMALIASNRRRRRVRKWITIGSIPLVLAGVALSGKMLSMYAFAHQSISSYVVDDYEGTIRAGNGQEILNWFEPYKAPYNVGVGLAASMRLDEARAKFEEALELAHGLEVCAVRVNLALVIEQMGDAAQDAGETAIAGELFAEALTLTVETPEECKSPEANEQSPDPERDLEETIDGLSDRLQEKQQQQQSEQPPPSEEPEPEEPQPSEEKLDDLEERLNQGQQERENRDREEGDESGSGTDRPW